jgi:hypothetical protein
MRRVRSAWLAIPLAVFGLGTGIAAARVEAGSAYTKTQTFSAALRYLRVDRGYEVTEKDADAAYLLFRYPLPGTRQSADGSLEVVETSAGVKIYVQLPRLPEYHEAVLRDGLLRKLRDEYGEPPPKAPAKPGARDGREPSKPSDPNKPGEPNKPKA